MEVKAEKTKEVVIPELLLSEFKKDTTLRKAFNALSPYKQKEFSEHISEAKQEKTISFNKPTKTRIYNANLIIYKY